MATFVGGTTTVHVTSETSITGAMPSGLSAGDLVFAFVMRRADPVAPPSGWSLIHAGEVFEGNTNEGTTTFVQSVYVYQKNSVASSDSGVEVTFEQQASDRMGLMFAAAGAGADVLEISSATFNNQENTNTVSPPALIAGGDDELFIVAGSTILNLGTTQDVTPPSGFSLFSGPTLTGYRLAGAQKIVSAPFTNSGQFTFGSEPNGNFNGLWGVTIRIGTEAPDNECISGAPSMLVAPGSLLAINDFSAAVAGLRSFYLMELLGPFGRVRVPISSWQATLRADLSNYLQCVVPAAEPWAELIASAESFAILRAAILPNGQTLEYVMASAGVDNTDLSQGTANYTVTMSGYTAGVSFGYDALAPKPIVGVRGRFTSGGGTRFRCAIDWLLRPGQQIVYEGAVFNVGFINYYSLAEDSYMDVGEGA